LEVMGSHEGAAAPVQQPLLPQQSAGTASPSMTRRAASPYFSFTIAVIVAVLEVSVLVVLVVLVVLPLVVLDMVPPWVIKKS
jgi:hypothetical protein